ncbi:hypothetical protein Tco_1570665 [Tanacetum coccineum]
MSSITAQQTKLDLELVPKEKRLDIKVYMIDQFWDSVYKHDTFYRFKIDKRKRFKLNLGIFRDIFKICPRVQGQDFDALPTDEEIVYFLRDLSHTKEIHSLNDVVVDQMHQPWRTFATLINRNLSGKTSVERERDCKDCLQGQGRGVVIRETPEIPVSKKKEKVDVTRGKGTELISQVALTEDAQFEEVERESEGRFHRETIQVDLGNDEDNSNNKKDTSGEDSDQENASDDDKTQSDKENESNSKHEKDENESDSISDQEENEKDDEDDEEEEEEEEVVKTPSNDSDDEDQANINNKVKGNENPKITQVIEDSHVTLSTVPHKTEVPVTSSSHSSDLAAKFLKFSGILHTDAKIVSPMDVHIHHEVPNQQTPILLIVPVLVISETSPTFSIIIPQSIPSFTPPLPQSTPTPPPTTEAIKPPSTLPNFASVF